MKSGKELLILICLGYSFSDKYSIEQFLKQGTGGVIVNAGSIHSFVSLPTPTAYSSAKGGVKLLTQNLCTAYAKYGIRINAVCPGYINTPLLGSVNPQQKRIFSFTSSTRQTWNTRRSR